MTEVDWVRLPYPVPNTTWSHRLVVSQAPDERFTGVRFTLGLPNNDFASDSLLEREAADNRLQRGSTPRRSTKITGGLALVKQARTVGSIPIPSTNLQLGSN